MPHAVDVGRGSMRGSRDAPFEVAVTAHAQRLMALALLLTRNRADADDLVQGTFERAFSRWARVRSPTEEAYLRRIMINLATDGYRRRGRRPEVLVAEPEGGGHDPYAAVDQRDLLLQLVRRLPPRQRAIVVLRYWADLSEQEIAAELSIAPGTVKSQAAKALRQLRDESVGYQWWPESG